jgi:hypothetical protein
MGIGFGITYVGCALRTMNDGFVDYLITINIGATIIGAHGAPYRKYSVSNKIYQT